MSTGKMTGRALAKEFSSININAMWVSGQGMIFMSAYYGCDCSVQGKYALYSLATAADVFQKIKSARATGDDDPLECWLHDREISNRYYTVR